MISLIKFKHRDLFASSRMNESNWVEIMIPVGVFSLITATYVYEYRKGAYTNDSTSLKNGAQHFWMLMREGLVKYITTISEKIILFRLTEK